MRSAAHASVCPARDPARSHWQLPRTSSRTAANTGAAARARTHNLLVHRIITQERFATHARAHAPLPPPPSALSAPQHAHGASLFLTQGHTRRSHRPRPSALLASQHARSAFFSFRVPTLFWAGRFSLLLATHCATTPTHKTQARTHARARTIATRSALRHACTHARTHARARTTDGRTTNVATCGPPAWPVKDATKVPWAMGMGIMGLFHFYFGWNLRNLSAESSSLVSTSLAYSENDEDPKDYGTMPLLFWLESSESSRRIQLQNACVLHCGACLTGRLHEGGIRSSRSPRRRPPLLATPIATPLQGGRPERYGLLFLKLPRRRGMKKKQRTNNEFVEPDLPDLGLVEML